LLPFEISRGVVDRVRAEVASERKPQLIWIDPRDPAAAPQMLSGLWPDSWTSKSANILLKQPDHPMPLRIDFYIPKPAAARRVQWFVDGELIDDRTYPEPGHYIMTTPPMMPNGPITITITVDKTVSTPEDHRAMGMILVGAGFTKLP
jgi:hypothetical protein